MPAAVSNCTPWPTAQILGGAAAHNNEGGEFPGGDGRNRHVGFHQVAGPLGIRRPTWLAIVDHQVERAAGRSGHHRFPTLLEKALVGVQSFVTVAAVAGQNEDLPAHTLACLTAYHQARARALPQ